MTNIELRFFESAISFFSRKKEPDWEQRRYEIAKEVLPKMVERYMGFTQIQDFEPVKTAIEHSIMIADDTVEKLKAK